MSGWWIAAVAAGGVGAGLRVAGTRLLETRLPGGAATATSIVNVVGAGALGLVVATGSANAALVLGAGLLGGLTTFSTWMVQVDRAPRFGAVMVLLVVPVVAGAAAFALGLALV